MKKVFFAVIIWCIPSVLFSQVLTQRFAKGEAVEKGVKIKKEITSGSIIELPKVDIEKLLMEDAEVAGEDVPYRFGYGFDTSYSLKDGEWDNVEGGRLWSLCFKSNGAVSLNFIFNDFSLPDGAFLNIVNSDETIVYGPVTSDNIPQDRFFLSDVIPDSMVTIYLFEPESQKGKSTLIIKKVVHGYRDYYEINDGLGSPGNSATCNIPVENGYPTYEQEANAIALIIMKEGTSYCSGSLIMSTDLSFKPYLLTAFHCVNTEMYSYYHEPTDTIASSAEQADVNHWAIKFGFRQQSSYAITFNGANYRAGWFNSDFALVELYENAKQFANLVWLGWDRTGNFPTSGVGIHHPKGDYMKIAIDNDCSQSSMWTSILYPSNMTQHWVEHWDTGIVQNGSSGSPLLNQNKRVVGQLHGVVYEAGHNNNTPPCDINYGYYGKISISWTGGGSNDTRLSNWLDPIGRNITTTDSSHPIFINGSEKLYNSSGYSVQNLPSGYTVSWSLTGSNASNFTLQTDSLSTNQCTITRKDHVEFSGSTYLLLTSQITRNDTVITTLTKGLDALYISGESNPCLTDVYHVEGLPSDYTVTWNLSGTGYSVITDFVPTNTENNNYLGVQRASSQSYASGTITATLMSGNNVVGTLTKRISSGWDFTGTWFKTSSIFPPFIPDSTPQPLNCGMTIVNTNERIVLQSDDFIGATMSCTSGNAIIFPHSNTIVLTTGSDPLTSTIIEVYKSGTCEAYKFYFRPIGEPIPLEFSINGTGHEYVFSLREKQNSERGDEHLAESKSLGQWQLAILQYETGQIVFKENVEDKSLSVNTSGWKAGVYIAVAIINGKSIAQKLAITE